MTSLNPKIKSFIQFFSKNCGFQRQSLWSHSAECETPYRSSVVWGARGLFAREKVLENRLQVECDLKNYPVDDF